jgi:hypothetical protein
MHSAVEIPCLEAGEDVKSRPVASCSWLVSSRDRMSASPKWPALPVTRLFIWIFAFTISAPDAKGVITYRVATGPSTAMPITNRDAAIFELSRTADDYSSLALSRLLQEGGPTFSQPEEYL